MIVGRVIAENRGELWLDTRQRVRDLVATVGPDELARSVPAAPGRTVRDIVDQLVTAGQDALAGDVHPTHVTRSRGAGGTDAELLAAWDRQAEEVAALVRNQPRAARLLIDLVAHEHDLRDVLGRPGGRDDDAVALAVELLGQDFGRRVQAAGVPALRMTCEQWGHETGPPPYYAIIVADRFELFRALTGRRSANEVRRWMWSADPEPYLPYLAVDGALRATDLNEFDPDVPPEFAERLRTRSWREPVA